jgi:hypothetical protein
MNVQLFALFSALSILGMRRERTFNAVVAGSRPARLTIIFQFQNDCSFKKQRAPDIVACRSERPNGAIRFVYRPPSSCGTSILCD